MRSYVNLIIKPLVHGFPSGRIAFPYLFIKYLKCLDVFISACLSLFVYRVLDILFLCFLPSNPTLPYFFFCFLFFLWGRELFGVCSFVGFFGVVFVSLVAWFCFFYASFWEKTTILSDIGSLSTLLSLGIIQSFNLD